MPDKKYFLSLGGSFLLGCAVVIISLVLTFLLAPYLVPVFADIFPYLMDIVIWFLIFITIIIIISGGFHGYFFYKQECQKVVV